MNFNFTKIGGLLKQPKLLGASVAAMFIAIGIGYAISVATGSVEPPAIVETGSAEEPSITTENPVLLSNSSSTIILGTVLSNEIANIYPRRQGIVEDIYVDIGDTVYKNQVVALLLPQGVEGQSAAKIAEKNARKAQAQADYLSAQAVSEETLINARQKIQEKETSLLIAQREQGTLLEQFAEQEDQIRQMVEQAFTSVRKARQVVEQILIGSNSRPGVEIQEQDLLDQLGLLSPETRYDTAPLFTGLYDAENAFLSMSDSHKQEEVKKLLSLADRALVSAVELLGSTPSVPIPQPGLYTQQELANLTNRVLSSQDNILKAKEKLEDAENSFDRLISSEQDLYRAYISGNTDGVMSNKVRMTESQLQTIQNGYFLTEANQEQVVERYRNMVGVADAQLQSEYTQSGHRQIRSPFAGTVSKRFMDVGQIVSPSMASFELTDVPTSLAKKAKREIQFGLPEYLGSALSSGDMIAFFLPDQEEETYQAEVTRISPQVDQKTHTVTVQAKLEDTLKLPHNTSVRVRIIDRSTPLFRVPSFAVKREEDINIVWILDEETEIPRKARVSVRSEDGEFAEVTGNIVEESLIILDPPDLLTFPEEETSESIL